MKKTILILLTVLISNCGFSQNTRKEIMEDSLWNSVVKFCTVVEKYLDKDKVTQSDVNNFLDYVYEHTTDSVQTAHKFIPFMTTKEQAMSILINQTKDMVGKKCSYEFSTWDGWDGISPYVMFQFKISHDGYKDQFMVIVRCTDDLITSIFSADSKL